MCFGRSDTRTTWDMAHNPKLGTEKTLDAELAKFASQDSKTTVSVIVEMALPPSQVELTDAGPGKGPVRPRVALPADESSWRDGMDALERQLRQLFGAAPVRLDPAQAFVVELTPDQLRTVMRLAEAGTIRPNRRHYP